MEDSLLSIELKTPSIKQVEKDLGEMKSKAPIVISRAINRTITHLCTQMDKEIKKNYDASKLRKKDVKKTLKVHRSSSSKLEGHVVSISKEKIPLYRFKTNPNKPVPKKPPKFYESKVLKNGPFKKLTGDSQHSKGFIAKMSNDHIGVYERKLDKQRKEKRPGRSLENDPAIVERYGPSIPKMLKARRVSDNLTQDSSEFLQKQIKHDVKYYLGVK